MVVIQSVKNGLFILAFPVEKKICPSPIRDGMAPKWDKTHSRWILQDQKRQFVKPGDGAWLYDGKNAWYLNLAVHAASKEYRLVDENGVAGDFLTRSAVYTSNLHRSPEGAAAILASANHTTARGKNRAGILRDQLGRFASKNAAAASAPAR